MLLILQGPWPLPAQDIPEIGIGPLYRKGLGHLRNNESAEAEAAWQALLRRAPNHFNAHLGLGKLLLRRSPGRAGRHLKTAADLRPASDAAHYHLGRYLEGQGYVSSQSHSRSIASRALPQYVRRNPSSSMVSGGSPSTACKARLPSKLT